MTTAIVVAGFGLLWAAVAFEWLTETGIYWGIALVAVLVVVLVFLAVRRKRPRGQSSEHLYASDEYSDLYLGRRRGIPPHRDVGETSQLGDGYPSDPLSLRHQQD